MHVENNIKMGLSSGNINYFIQLNYRWPVPMPHWRHPDFVDEDKSDDDEFVSEPKSRRRREYTYTMGVKKCFISRIRSPYYWHC